MTNEQRKFINEIRYHWFLRILFPKDTAILIACQFALESNFGKSKLAQENNNLCGMKTPKRRVFYGIKDEKTEFAKYPTKDHCIVDYCSWVLYNRPNNINIASAGHYASWLDIKKYCPEKDYIKKIVSLYNTYQQYEK